MLPKPFRPQALDDQREFLVRDEVGGLVWHRVFHRPLYADTDRSGLVYHANYLRYFELGRASVMRDFGYAYKAVEDSGFVYPIVDLGVRYFKPLFYDDPMWIHTRPSKIERVRVSFEYVITHAETGHTVCRGFTMHCALNSKRIPVAVDAKTVSLWRDFPQ